MVLNKKELRTPFEETSLQELNKCLQVLFVGNKKRRPRPFGHRASKLQTLTTVNELKIIIFELKYLTVLFSSVSVASGGINLGKELH